MDSYIHRPDLLTDITFNNSYLPNSMPAASIWELGTTAQSVKVAVDDPNTASPTSTKLDKAVAPSRVTSLTSVIAGAVVSATTAKDFVASTN